MKDPKDTTTPLPPSPSSSSSDVVTNAEYTTVQEIIMDLWDHCMQLEDEFHETGDQSILLQFGIAIMTVQYWEDVLMNMEDREDVRFRF